MLFLTLVQKHDGPGGGEACRSSGPKTADEVTKRPEWAAGKGNRLEKALAVQPRVADICLLPDPYGVTDEAAREALFTLAR